MQPHVERMVKELGELHDRVTNLDIFIAGNPLFNEKLTDEQRDLMVVQRNAMRIYEWALRKRISLENS